MTRRPYKPTLFAVALQAASLLVIASGVFGILVNDIIRHSDEVARVEVPSKVQLLASPYDGDAEKPR
jgi:hypothetical protein